MADGKEKSGVRQYVIVPPRDDQRSAAVFEVTDTVDLNSHPHYQDLANQWKLIPTNSAAFVPGKDEDALSNSAVFISINDTTGESRMYKAHTVGNPYRVASKNNPHYFDIDNRQQFGTLSAEDVKLFDAAFTKAGGFHNARKAQAPAPKPTVETATPSAAKPQEETNLSYVTIVQEDDYPAKKGDVKIYEDSRIKADGGRTFINPRLVTGDEAEKIKNALKYAGSKDADSFYVETEKRTGSIVGLYPSEERDNGKYAQSKTNVLIEKNSGVLVQALAAGREEEDKRPARGMPPPFSRPPVSGTYKATGRTPATPVSAQSVQEGAADAKAKPLVFDVAVRETDGKITLHTFRWTPDSDGTFRHEADRPYDAYSAVAGARTKAISAEQYERLMAGIRAGQDRPPIDRKLAFWNSAATLASSSIEEGDARKELLRTAAAFRKAAESRIDSGLADNNRRLRFESQQTRGLGTTIDGLPFNKDDPYHREQITKREQPTAEERKKSRNFLGVYSDAGPPPPQPTPKLQHPYDEYAKLDYNGDGILDTNPQSRLAAQRANQYLAAKSEYERFGEDPSTRQARQSGVKEKFANLWNRGNPLRAMVSKFNAGTLSEEEFRETCCTQSDSGYAIRAPDGLKVVFQKDGEAVLLGKNTGNINQIKIRIPEGVDPAYVAILDSKGRPNEGLQDIFNTTVQIAAEREKAEARREAQPYKAVLARYEREAGNSPTLTAAAGSMRHIGRENLGTDTPSGGAGMASGPRYLS